MYFTSADYLLFTAENAAVKSTGMQKKRQELQGKLLAMHERIYPDVQKMGLGCHPDAKSITTSINPDKSTGLFPAWILVRYGKTAEELAPFQDIKELGFIKHACLQFGLFEGKGFCIELYLGGKDGFDRQRLRRAVVKNRKVIESEIEMLRGYKMQWEITGCEPYRIDEEIGGFCDWLLANDARGGESFLTLPYGILDESLTPQQIALEILRKIRLLLPLYNALTLRK